MSIGKKLIQNNILQDCYCSSF